MRMVTYSWSLFILIPVRFLLKRIQAALSVYRRLRRCSAALCCEPPFQNHLILEHDTGPLSVPEMRRLQLRP